MRSKKEVRPALEVKALRIFETQGLRTHKLEQLFNLFLIQGMCEGNRQNRWERGPAMRKSNYFVLNFHPFVSRQRDKKGN